MTNFEYGVLVLAAEDVQVHLKSMRDKCARILNDTGESGRGIDGEIDREKLWGKNRFIWDRLDFVRPFITPRASKSSTKVRKYTILTKMFA